MLTGDEYLASLDDGRQVWRAGRRVEDVRQEPFLALALAETVAGYNRFHDPTPGATNTALRPPASIAQMREQAPAVESLDLLLGTTYQSLNALLVAASRLEPDTAATYGPRMRGYVDEALRRDLRIAECITDAKGDRSRHPGEQPDPDSYVHVVERRPDGVVIRGAKMHVSGAALAHDLLVMPTKTMRPDEEQYAVACAVPVGSPGLHVTTAGYVPLDRDPRDYPASGGRHSAVESMCIFEDVFVPTERVFLDGETSQAATLAHALGLWERLGGLSFMVSRADEQVGLAQLIAEANGTHKIAHVREKIDEMMIHATLLRAGLEAAISNGHQTPEGSWYPDDMYTNVAKYLGATQGPLMVRHLHEIAGGAIVTGPSAADFDDPELGPLVDKYLAGAPGVSGRYRSHLFRTIRDTTADAYGGWWSVGSLQGGGGLVAQRVVTRRHYDLGRARSLALRAAGLLPEQEPAGPVATPAQPTATAAPTNASTDARTDPRTDAATRSGVCLAEQGAR